MACTCNNTPCTTCCQPEVNCEPCQTLAGCPINLDTSCVFYNLSSDVPSSLTCLGISNGISLKTILEAIDTKLCENLPDIGSYLLPCLRNSYVILNFQQFSEAVDYELCRIDATVNSNFTTLQTSINNLSTTVTSILYPAVSDCGSLSLEPTDSIFIVLQKYADAICNIQANCCTDNSPNLNVTNSSSISFVTSGSKNHNLTGSVKLSAVAGNLIQHYPDGLYCTVTVPDYTQTLSWDSGTNTLSLSGGGGSVVLNLDTDDQTLSFNCTTKILTISEGNSVDLSCIAGGAFSETVFVANDSTSINFTTAGTSGHILTGDVILSPNAGNILTNPGNGLYVPDSTDIKVKLNGIDPTADYLETKLAGKVNALITTLVTSNNISHQAEFESVLDVAALLSTITSTPAFLTTFCTMVKECLCFKFRLTNTDGAITYTYDYVDCNGTTHTSLNLGPGVSLDICGESVDVSNPAITIQNLGYC